MAMSTMSVTEELPACGEDIGDADLYNIYRNYVEHEDDLINNRVGWFIQLHSFLIASYGIVFAALISTFFVQGTPLVPPIGPQGVACGLLIGIAFIGSASAFSATQSITAANDAIQELNRRWKILFEQRGGGLNLPGLTGGGHPGSTARGARFQLVLPRVLVVLWFISFSVPAAFWLMALDGSRHSAATAAAAPISQPRASVSSPRASPARHS